MKEWSLYQFCSMDGQAILVNSPCSFQVCLQKKDRKTNISEIVDFGIFDSKPKYNFTFNILSFMKKDDVFRIPLNNPIVVKLHNGLLSMHDIKRTLKPGMWLNLPHNGLNKIGIFQGFYSKRKYIFKVQMGRLRDSDFVLLSPLVNDFKMRDLYAAFNVITAAADVVSVHDC